MFNKHLITKINNEEVLYLFVDYNYEFAKLGEQNHHEKTTTIFQKVMNYIRDKKIIFNGTKIFLVLNGLIIGTLMLTNYPYTNLRAEISPKYQYVEHIDNFDKPKIDISDKKEIEEEIKKNVIPKKSNTTEKNNTVENKETIPKTTKPKVNEPEKSTDKTTTTPIPEKKETKEDIPSTEETQKDSPIAEETEKPVEKEETTSPMLNEGRTVVIYRSNGTIEEIALEDYIVGVVAAEMPAAFPSEALKAQAVTARTYAMKAINEGKALTDTVSTQAYKDINQLKAYWGNNFETYFHKIQNAVKATKGEYLTYNGKYIEALFFSTSNGRTENASDVWGNSFPYLVSVDSHWDTNSPSYLRESIKDLSVVNKTLGISIDENTPIEVISKTAGDSIATIRIDDDVYTGKYLRDLLGLRSTDFDMKIEGNKVLFTTRGYGHGVGMSQYGALGMAKQGSNYRQILTHYYPGTIIRG